MQPDAIFEELEKNRRNSVHFIGIGGIGLSSLARWFMAGKWAVTGSDIADSELTLELKKEGVKLEIGQKKGIPEGTTLVIRSQAIRPDNPEYKAAVRRKTPILTYPEMVGILSRRYKTLAVAGAHGKSTTTSLLALILMRAGLDPTVIVGTKLKELDGSNFRKGRSEYLALEADEYGRAFLNYSPFAAIVTNIDREHLDIYKGLPAIKSAFMEFLNGVPAGGALVLNADNENLLTLRPRIESLALRRKLRIFWYSVRDAESAKVKKVLRLPGEHNLSNALAAFTLARKGLGLPEAAILKAIGAFKGSWRRFDLRGKYNLQGAKFTVFDDYAHHPSEIRATLASFRERFPGAALICVFQPHQAERLRRLFGEFKTAFEEADALLLFPEYKVAGREEKPSAYTGKALALSVKRKYPRQAVLYVDEPAKFGRTDILMALRNSGKPAKEAVVVMMGAGNIINYTSKLIAK